MEISISSAFSRLTNDPSVVDLCRSTVHLPSSVVPSTASPNKISLSSFPNELTLKIFEYLDLKGVLNVEVAARSFRDRSKFAWQAISADCPSWEICENEPHRERWNFFLTKGLDVFCKTVFDVNEKNRTEANDVGKEMQEYFKFLIDRFPVYGCFMKEEIFNLLREKINGNFTTEEVETKKKIEEDKEELKKIVHKKNELKSGFIDKEISEFVDDEISRIIDTKRSQPIGEEILMMLIALNEHAEMMNNGGEDLEDSSDTLTWKNVKEYALRACSQHETFAMNLLQTYIYRKGEVYNYEFELLKDCALTLEPSDSCEAFESFLDDIDLFMIDNWRFFDRKCPFFDYLKALILINNDKRLEAVNYFSSAIEKFQDQERVPGVVFYKAADNFYCFYKSTDPFSENLRELISMEAKKFLDKAIKAYQYEFGKIPKEVSDLMVKITLI